MQQLVTSVHDWAMMLYRAKDMIPDTKFYIPVCHALQHDSQHHLTSETA
jgi:hypothetical protein